MPEKGIVFSDELNSPGTFRVTPSGVRVMLGGNKAFPSEILEARYVFIVRKLTQWRSDSGQALQTRLGKEIAGSLVAQGIGFAEGHYFLFEQNFKISRGYRKFSDLALPE